MSVAAVLTGVLPSLGVLGVFVYVMRGITRADRREREAIADYDREQEEAAAKLASGHKESDSSDPAP